MAEYIEVARPDGKIVTVSRKLFGRSYRAQGYREVTGRDDVDRDAPDLIKLKRSELITYAESLGIENPDAIGNMEKIRSAIEAMQEGGES